ncbi:extracellular solute-binding protein [Paenibacillus sp. CGMCC 1.16610]|uniref:Extracellular solute-binding protein n=1 Tax=Paenibacillus anseongense TaxID=2682845 RepID=A0ABW9U6E9_9BACL|nr:MULTISPECIES: extracellular solute-binding protein [Paenibacillus]MBA2938873.1 extracellular solute-binding protein [Paenibacillus sp. CGMCC 1.16610]MVQ34835.1 extracellular solute-binding protein [Paenibacillus anseongense]
MNIKKLGLVSAACLLAITAVTACSTKNGTSDSSAPSAKVQDANGSEVVDIEVWGTNIGYKPITKGSKLYELYKEKLGVGVIHPYVEWNGGTNYLNQLNLKIAAGEIPDLFLPKEGIENSLAKNGAIADLTDLLPKYAPNLWEAIPKDIWDIVKANDPTGQGKIYFIPGVVDYGRYAGMIRKDWLDKLGLQMPKTQDEYVKVLEAFRDKDPNGNGLKDELPTGGRQEARWMDHLFAMYGVAMFEGYPQWDLYDGKLSYAAVTPNMKAALEFAAKLYKDGLLDKESLLNDKAKWDGKVNDGRAGNFFHWAETSYLYMENTYKNTGVKPDFAVLPIPEVPGYKGFYTWKRFLEPQWVVKNSKDQKKLMATLKLLNNMYDKKNWNALFLGVEGMHYTMKDGKAVRLPDDKSTQENLILDPYSKLSTLDFMTELNKSTASEDRMWAVDQTNRNMQEAQKYAKTIAGDGIPASIYDGFPDINNRTLFIEYATKIILGQYPLSKFDEFVEKWNKTGGEEVTKRAREWYSKVKK